MDQLEALLAERIRAEGPLTFADFMETALYHPELGYYGRGSPVGTEGDYVTAVELPGFATCLARQVAEMWERLDRPDPFHVVELGAGSGRLGRDLRAALETAHPPCAGALRYVAVEPGTAQREGLEAAGVATVANVTDVPGARLRGVVLGNEVLDALPVHLVRGADAGLEEARVTLQDGGLALRWGEPSTPRLAALLDDEAVALAPGQETAVSLRALDLVDDVAGVLEAGYAVFLDYGDEAALLRDPARGSTLRAFRDHRVGGELLAEPGHRDLTASVDFTALRQRARARGLEAALTTQGRFLVALGILDVHEALGPVVGAGVKTLVVPGGMGERYKVLILAAGAPLAGLTGLTNPFAPPEL